MVETDALNLDLVFPPQPQWRPGCTTCLELRVQLVEAASDDQVQRRSAAFDAHVLTHQRASRYPARDYQPRGARVPAS